MGLYTLAARERESIRDSIRECDARERYPDRGFGM